MMVNRTKAFLSKFDHILLLASLTFLIASPVWEQVFHLGYLLPDFMIIVVIVSGISVTYSHKLGRINLRLYFGLFTVIVSLISNFFDFSRSTQQVIQTTQVIFFILLTLQLFTQIIKAKEVDPEVLVNAVSGYLLLGLSWAIVIMIWASSFPNSFNFSGTGEFFNAMYYSFVTLTTLGYGDMLPISASAKTLSIMIAVSGAFYTTIILGMIVGKYISYESIKNINKNK